MLGLKPFFCYFGGKWRIAPKYPAPKYNTIVEPFAGAAGYSTRYYDRKIILYEIDPKIFWIWDYLIKSSSSEILNLPEMVEDTETLNIPQEAKWLIGFWLNKGASQPCNKPSSFMKSALRPNSQWGKEIRNRLAYQVDLIKHWEIENRSYESDDSNAEVTWFIDPPYYFSGKHYKFNKIDYENLSKYCQSRLGQVIVCEQDGAKWLPFQKFATIKAMEGNRGKKQSKEVIWTN
jgi:site-specific DNA-adenine methylase